MKVNELIPDNKYNATCFNGAEVTFIEVVQECSDGSALITIQYKNKLYFASSYQLYIERR